MPLQAVGEAVAALGVALPDAAQVVVVTAAGEEFRHYRLLQPGMAVVEQGLDRARRSGEVFRHDEVAQAQAC